MRTRLAMVSVYLFVLLSSSHGAMQAPVLSGVVTDTNGAVIPGAAVTVTARGATTPIRTSLTDEKGRFSIVMLLPGTYEIRFELTGFKTEVKTITIAAGGSPTTIRAAIDDLRAGGSTNGGEGIVLAYRLAREQFTADAVNRVILVTDGDFNVGLTSEDALVRLIERERKSGVFLSVFGVGTGNVNDATMESLADKGNGNYAYLDSLREARKVLVRESDATLVTVAKDVKIQVEFNPREVAAYRLIGYENRLLDEQDFNDDEKDAAEIGAGQTVTALYEIVPAGEAVPGASASGPSVDPLKYQHAPKPTRASGRGANGRGANGRGENGRGELMTVKLRYKRPDAWRSQRIETVVRADVRPLGPNAGFASAVAELGMLLRRSRYAGDASVAHVVARAREFRGADPYDDRAEFITLAEKAGVLLEKAKAGQPSQNQDYGSRSGGRGL